MQYGGSFSGSSATSVRAPETLRRVERNAGVISVIVARKIGRASYVADPRALERP